MPELKTLPALLDSVTVLRAVAQLYYENNHREALCARVSAARKARGADGRRDAIAEGAAVVVEEVLGLFDLGGCVMDDRLGAVHATVYGLLESDTGGPEGDDVEPPVGAVETAVCAECDEPDCPGLFRCSVCGEDEHGADAASHLADHGRCWSCQKALARGEVSGGHALRLAASMARIERSLDAGLQDGTLSPHAPSIVAIGRELRRTLGVRPGSATGWLP